MTDKEVKQIVDENISKLFWALLPKTPVAVGEGFLEYEVNESCVKIMWRRKYKHDCLHRFGMVSFNDYMYAGFPNTDKNPIVEGITFVIETKDGMFIVPELSRTETVKAQELIEEAYRTYAVHSVMDLYKAVK